MQTRIAGRGPWLREAIAPGERDEPALEGAQRADICIVGGGMAGMWTALELKRRQPELDIAIVEADILAAAPAGEIPAWSYRNGAKFAALQAFCGTEGAIRLGHAFGNSATEIDAFFREEGIDIEFRRDGWIWGRHLPAPCRLLERYSFRTCATRPGALPRSDRR